MITSQEKAIPYERQAEPGTSRTCGAACLCMIYRSFGKTVPQSEIWPAISKVNQFGSLASTTHLMTQDALNRGFAAVAIQARHPLHALRVCYENGIQAILNHRLHGNSGVGHYSVLVDLDGNHVVLHDPTSGPSRRISQAELLALWQPHFSDSEIVGGVLIAVASDPPPMEECRFCHTVIPPSVECPRCRKSIGLSPRAVLGCVKHDCIARMWSHLCCPSCDLMVDSISLAANEATRAHVAADANDPLASAITEPPNLKNLFKAMDEFRHQVQGMPSAANHPEIQKQFQILTDAKAALMLGLADAVGYAQMHKERLAAFTQASEKRAEEHRKEMQAINTPPPPLDGAALGRALLKNVGFIV